VPILAVHDQIVLECDEGAAPWLETAAMVDGMDEVVNGPRAAGPHMPVKVEADAGASWG
jgi:hypothetical protein